MRVFAGRLKNGRSWSDRGIAAFIQLMVALKDGLDIKTLVGTMKNKLEAPVESKPLKNYLEKLKSSAGEAARDNVFYLQQSNWKTCLSCFKGDSRVLSEVLLVKKNHTSYLFSWIFYIQGSSVDWSAERRLQWDEAGQLRPHRSVVFATRRLNARPTGKRPLGTEINVA